MTQAIDGRYRGVQQGPTMTLKDWLKLNPNHRCTTRAMPGDRVAALLHGGEGVDQRLVGEGVDEGEAARHALETRTAIREQLP